MTAPRWEDVPEADRAVFVDVMTRMRDDLARRARDDHGRTDIGDRSVAMFDAALARLAEPAQPTAAERWRAVPAEERERARSVVYGTRCNAARWVASATATYGAEHSITRNRARYLAALDALLALAREAEGGR